MTPREIRCLFRSYERQEQKRQEDRALLARFIALAVHAPDRLPPVPSFAAPGEAMTDEEMKNRLMRIAGKEMT